MPTGSESEFGEVSCVDGHLSKERVLSQRAATPQLRRPVPGTGRLDLLVKMGYEVHGANRSSDWGTES